PSARRVYAGLQSGRLAEIALQFDDAQLQPLAGEFLSRVGERSIRRAVVDENELPWLSIVCQGRTDAIDQWRDVVFLVMHRDDDGKIDLVVRGGNCGKGLRLLHWISPEHPVSGRSVT